MKMNTVFAFVALLCLSSACKKVTKPVIEPDGAVAVGEDDEKGEEGFEPYVDTFMDRLRVAGIDRDTSLLRVEFSDTLPPNILGGCSQLEGHFEVVSINRNRWKDLSVGSREELIFHELGHCVLNRGHNSAMVNFIPVSIMNPYHFGAGTYASEVFYEGYQTELFGTAPEVFAGYLFDPALYGATHYSHDHTTSRRSADDLAQSFCSNGP